jgi:chitin disaccharide deacetylase
VQRSLIINCDDVGMCAAVDEAAVAAVTEGGATSLSIMAPAPHFTEAVELVRSRGITHVGVHLTLTSEIDAFRWGGVSPAADIGSLLGRDGTLHSTARDFGRAARADEVLRECERQIGKVCETGLVPSHLDCHMFALHERVSGREDLQWVIAELCERHRLPFRAAYPEEAVYLTARGLPIVSQVDPGTYDVPPADKFRAYLKIVEELESGVSELIIHPGLDTPELRLMDRPGRDRSGRRIQDMAFACSRELLDAVAAHGVALVAWEDAF